MIDAKREDGIKVTQTAVAEFEASIPKMENYAMDGATRRPREHLPPRGEVRSVADSPELQVGRHGFGLPRDVVATMEVTLFCRSYPCKFKILSLTSC